MRHFPTDLAEAEQHLENTRAALVKAIVENNHKEEQEARYMCDTLPRHIMALRQQSTVSGIDLDF